MRAIWNDQVIAQSDDTVIVEDNHYFPKDSLAMEYFEESHKTTTCPWKGTAYYFHISVKCEKNEDAAWYYPDPKEEATEIKDRVAFWKGVQIVE